MARGGTAMRRDTSIGSYRAKRDFTVTAEPAPGRSRAGTAAPMFVVQKHQAHRAGLHWDFRLEHDGVLWSWAVRKGPSLDPSVKHIAVHVEDHPTDYADFQGTIPEGEYGAGTVETWDRGTWEPVNDPDAGMQKGELTFIVHGTRLNGRFHLVRLRPKPGARSKADNWLLFKGHDAAERAGADAAAIEQTMPGPRPPRPGRRKRQDDSSAGNNDDDGDRSEGDRDRHARPAPAAVGGDRRKRRLARGAGATPVGRGDGPPAPGAKRATLPANQSPQLCAVAEGPPEGDGWISEIKFDGYRLLAWNDRGKPRLITRNGQDWTNRLPVVAAAIAALDVETALLDGELVALDKDGVSSFPALQAALSAGRDATLFFWLFDLLYLNGWDLRPCALVERKRLLRGLDTWQGLLRYSDHHEGDPAAMRREACRMKLEGIVCKQAQAPYHRGRGHGWLKVKCQGREEFVVLGWTPPRGTRSGLGALHLGYYDARHRLHYAGGVGTGFSDDELHALRKRLEALPAAVPRGLVVAGDPLDEAIRWVRPELVAEVQFVSWSGAGRVRHAVYMGLRRDKSAADVVRDVADSQAERKAVTPKQASALPIVTEDHAERSGVVAKVPPLPLREGVGGRGQSRTNLRSDPSLRPLPQGEGGVSTSPAPLPQATVQRRSQHSDIVSARKPRPRIAAMEGVTLTHPDRELWPGITKQHLAEYWRAVADHALPGLVHRPLAIVRCPEGIDGEHFFQKRGHGRLPDGVRQGEASRQPYLAIDDLRGLVGLTQISAIELHAWGAAEADPLHPDIIVFDLDPGEGVPFPDVVQAALDIGEKLERIGLQSFFRTTGGKGLHIVVPLVPEASWDKVKPFCRAFAEMLSEQQPERFLPTVKKIDRKGRILVDWLRNGLGATAVASFCPRARPGAAVATPLARNELTRELDPAAFNLQTLPKRLARLKGDPWEDFYNLRQHLPESASVPSRDSGIPPSSGKSSGGTRSSGGTVIVSARKPRSRTKV